MKTPKIVQVWVSDGSALYVNGKLVSDHFTCRESNLLNALGIKSWEKRQANENHYSTNPWPPALIDCVLHD